MKKIFTTIAAATFTLVLYAQNPIIDTVAYGPGYQNEFYYSLPNGQVGSQPLNSWDLGFTTDLMDATIIANNTRGYVYKVPNTDSSGWNLLDTTGYHSWNLLWNSQTNWHTGAFNSTANTGNPFDFGWGIYNMTTHMVVGDSLYVLSNPSGTVVKKLWIKTKLQTNHVIYRIANIDGTGDATIDVDCNASTKNFVYVDLSNNSQLDFEPATNTWDILFTRYITFIPQPYMVAGVFSNKHTKNAQADLQDFATVVYANYSSAMDTIINTIGYDWKTFNQGNGSWTVNDSTIYFVQSNNGDIWKMHFLSFGGGSTGQVILEKQLVQGAGINPSNESNLTSFVYPNPAVGNINFYCSLKNYGNISATLFDLSGKEIYTTSFSGTEGLKSYSMNATDMSNGIYLLHLSNGQYSSNLKVIISK